MAQKSELGHSLNKSLGLQLYIFLASFFNLFCENCPFYATGKERIIVLIKTNTECCKSAIHTLHSREKDQRSGFGKLLYMYSNI